MELDADRFIEIHGPEIQAAAREKRPVHIQFYASVTPQVIVPFQRLIGELHKYKPPEVMIAVSSGGGDSNLGYEMYNLLSALRGITLSTHNISVVSSASQSIYLAADLERRFATPVSEFLLHGSRFAEEKDLTYRKIRNLEARTDVDNRLIEELIVARTQITRRDVRRILRDEIDLNFTARNGVQKGFLLEENIRSYEIPENACLIMIHDPPKEKK